MSKKINKIVLYAPGVHTGGGYVLLGSVIKIFKNSTIFLDNRAKWLFNKKNNIILISNTFFGRLLSEIKLYFFLQNKYKILICFHGIPPIFAGKKTKIYLILQNLLLFEKIKFSEYSIKISLSLLIQKFILKILLYKVNTFIVQTPNMMRLFKKKLSTKKKIVLWPFMPLIKKNLYKKKIQWDFIYVADGLSHKNHFNLIDAWVELSKNNIRPSLALTISDQYNSIISYINDKKKIFNLNITNLGKISQKKIFTNYNKTSAIIYPSKHESFGLPLLEANCLKIPILASELDYVRDVCSPQQTFNPYSHNSIANAVMRFLGLNYPKLNILSPKEFVNKFTN